MTGETGLKPRLAALRRWAAQERIQKVAVSVVLVAGAAGLALTGWRFWPGGLVGPAPDFTVYEDTDQRKETFFGYFLPLVQTRNEEILELRGELQQLHDRMDSLSGRQQRRVEQVAEDYGLEEFDVASPEDWEVLLRRADVVPPSLALAQAANESAWGTSRFARQGNNYYGHWCFVEGCGLVPDSRPDGARHEVAAFDSAEHSVQRYIRNLNSHEAYTQLRLKREQLRESGELITGLKLAEGLGRYSERGEAYIEELQSMIRFNNLDELDEVALQLEP
ncbi:MAG: glucosaminidase domain-containing protein [Pseudohongiellaceae bacterium]